MSSFCPNCGNALPDDARFCTNCGTALGGPYVQNQMPVQQVSYQTQNTSDPNYAVSVYHQFLNKLDAAATAWLIIGIIQLVIGVFTIVLCVGAVPIIVGVWNIILSNKTKQNVKYFRGTSQGATAFIDSCGSGLAELLINIFLGTWLGIIAAVLDMTALSYGHNNRNSILFVEQNGLI